MNYSLLHIMYSLFPDALYCFKFQFITLFVLLRKKEILKQSVFLIWLIEAKLSCTFGSLICYFSV